MAEDHAEARREELEVDGGARGSSSKAGACCRTVFVRFSWVWFLLTGTAGVVIMKTMYEIHAPGRDGSSHSFQKPWFLNCIMFCGMLLLLPVFGLKQLVRVCVQHRPPLPVAPKLWWAVLIVSALDLVSGFVMNVGLLWISSSVWQMLRGSVIIFTAILKVVYRKKRLLSSEIVGVAVVVVAIAVVGAASYKTPSTLFDESSSTTTPNSTSSSLWWSLEDSSSSDTGAAHSTDEGLLDVVGVVLVIVAQALVALMVIIEEQLLHDVKDSDPVFIMGLSGLYGTAMCAGVFMPLAAAMPGAEGNGLHEDTLDTFAMLGSSRTLLVLALCYIVAISAFNLFGAYVVQVADAMVRNIIDPLRTLLVWVFMVALCYLFTDGRMGERVNAWSLLQLFGFVLLCLGILVTNGVLRFPCLVYKVVPEHGEELPLTGGSAPASSPSSSSSSHEAADEEQEQEQQEQQREEQEQD